ncbi:Na+/H+ antiporter subunit E [Desulfococcus sp.]|uniref:Na+/H+ antiporter subunit E n=1 Tax=Desulfococcus sp. TaxID=2025834 RepID=UPI0035946439
MMGHLLLRLVIWLLLTASLSPANLLIGLAAAWLLPWGVGARTPLKEVAKAMGSILLAIPQAYGEAFSIILRPHPREAVVRQEGAPDRPPGLVFLDIFRITFTPRTLVLKSRSNGGYLVHRLCPRRGPCS